MFCWYIKQNGTKKSLALVNCLGGISTDRVTIKINYLVLGDVGYSDTQIGKK